MSEDRPLLGEFHESGNRAAVECQERSNVRNVSAKPRIWSLTSTASSDRCAPCAGKRTACDQCGKSRRRGSGRATRRIGHQPDVLAKIHVSSEMVAHPCAVLKASHVMSQERNIHSASIGAARLSTMRPSSRYSDATIIRASCRTTRPSHHFGGWPHRGRSGRGPDQALQGLGD